MLNNILTKKFADFEDARKFARSLKLKSIKEWQFFSKNHRPNNIPSSPARSYVEKGWISWGDFLGTGNIAIKLRVFRDFEDARKFARSLKLKNYEEWREYCKTKNKPNDIPIRPQIVYKNSGWINMKDWLGNKK